MATGELHNTVGEEIHQTDGVLIMFDLEHASRISKCKIPM